MGAGLREVSGGTLPTSPGLAQPLPTCRPNCLSSMSSVGSPRVTVGKNSSTHWRRHHWLQQEGRSGGAPAQPQHPLGAPALPLCPGLREPVLVELGPHIGGRVLVEGVPGHIVLDQAYHCGGGGWEDGNPRMGSAEPRPAPPQDRALPEAPPLTAPPQPSWVGPLCLTWLLALQQAEHQAGEPGAVRGRAQGCKPHLPVKAWLVGHHNGGRPAHVPRLVHELDLLSGRAQSDDQLDLGPPAPLHQHALGAPPCGANTHCPVAPIVAALQHDLWPPSQTRHPPEQAVRVNQLQVLHGSKQAVGPSPEAPMGRGLHVGVWHLDRWAEAQCCPSSPQLAPLKCLPTKLVMNKATVAVPKMESWTAE